MPSLARNLTKPVVGFSFELYYLEKYLVVGDVILVYWRKRVEDKVSLIVLEFGAASLNKSKAGRAFDLFFCPNSSCGEDKWIKERVLDVFFFRDQI